MTQASHLESFHPVRRVEVRAQRPDRQVEHGPPARAVLIEHVEDFFAIPLPPAPWVAADQGTGQPGR